MSIWDSLREMSEKDYALISRAGCLLYKASTALIAVAGNDVLVDDIKSLYHEIQEHKCTDHRFRPDAQPLPMKGFKK
jgi:hypothetical protein